MPSYHNARLRSSFPHCLHGRQHFRLGQGPDRRSHSRRDRHGDQLGDGVKQTTKTEGQGLYWFPVLAVGTYEIEVSENGFQPYRVTGLRVDINSALVANVTLHLGEQTQAITVMEQSARVETANTQLGQVIGSKQVTEVPLNGRSYTDLLATQAGVTPLTTSGAQNSSSGGGFGTVPVAGNGNTGQFSINGQREDANGFYLNGASVQEAIGQQAGILPNLDSISRFPDPDKQF